MEYGIIQKIASGNPAASCRARKTKPSVRYGYPKEGFPLWMDNVAILKDAKNARNAKVFMNFIMESAKAALISALARCATGIDGSENTCPRICRSTGSGHP